MCSENRYAAIVDYLAEGTGYLPEIPGGNMTNMDFLIRRGVVEDLGDNYFRLTERGDEVARLGSAARAR